MSKTLGILLLVLLCVPLPLFAQEFNAGIVRGLWYSKESIFVGEDVRMYVAIRNNTGSDLTGTIEFFDGAKQIGRKNVQALDGRIIESWADWRPTYGEHTLKATLSHIELHAVGSSTKAVSVLAGVIEDTLFVDHDTDGDDIGNKEDADDDGDGVSDASEKDRGTNPLVAEKENNSENSGTNDEDESNTEKEGIVSGNGNDSTEGLEHYLAPGPARTMFSSMTEYITSAKETVDEYKNARTAEKESQKNREASAVNEGGFGEISRTQNTSGNAIAEGAQKGKGYFDKTIEIMKKVFSGVYGFLLITLSFILGHPVFVQLALLIGILYFIIRFAGKFGRRPSNY